MVNEKNSPEKGEATNKWTAANSLYVGACYAMWVTNREKLPLQLIRTQYTANPGQSINPPAYINYYSYVLFLIFFIYGSIKYGIV